MQAIEGFSRRLGRIWLLRGGLDGIMLGALAIGVLALITAFLTGPLPWIPAAIAIAVAAAVGALLAWRQRPSRDQARAIIEEYRPAGGLVLSAAAADPRWRERFEAPSTPRARFRYVPRLGRSLLALIFAIAALQLELDRPLLVDPAAGLTPTLSEAAATALELEELAEEMKIELTDLQPAIEAVDELHAAGELERGLEALDRLEEHLEANRAELGAELGRRDSSLGAAEALAAAAAELDDLGAQMRRQIAEALSELAEAGQGGELSPELQAAMEAAREALGGGDSALSQEALQQLAESLGEARQQALEQAAKACDSPGAGSKASPGALDALREALAEAASDDQPADDAVMTSLAGAGVGGTNHGPGHVELRIGDAADPEGSDFRELALPDRRDLSDSQVIGSSASESSAEAGAGSVGGALGVAAGSQAGLEDAVLPRHRKAVREYFASSPE